MTTRVNWMWLLIGLMIIALLVTALFISNETLLVGKLITPLGHCVGSSGCTM